VSTFIAPAWRTAPCQTRWEAASAALVRGSYSSASPGAAALQDHHRLGIRDLTERAAEPPAVLDALNVGRDYVGFLILTEVTQQIALVDVGSIAVGDDLAESMPLAPAARTRYSVLPPLWERKATRPLSLGKSGAGEKQAWASVCLCSWDQ